MDREADSIRAKQTPSKGGPGDVPTIAAGVVEEELLEWYLMSPAERWVESQRLWATFLLLGGSLDPEPDSQSPFDAPG